MTESTTYRRYLIYAGKILLLFGVYFLTAKFGLAINALNRFATIVWPPSGIAVATLLLFGPGLWPGIFLGAFLINFLTGAPLPAAAGIAVGNTLEAIIAAYLCNRGPGFHISLDRVQDVIRLVFRAAIVSAAVSASFGVSSLYMGGLLNADQMPLTWLQWWVGDGVGILTLTPILLVFSGFARWKGSWRLARIVEGALFAISLVAVNFLVFTGAFGAAITEHLKGPLIFPFLLWGAMRFGIRGAVISTFVSAGIAIWATAHGIGPFSTAATADQLLQLIIFVIVVAVIDLVVAANVTELIQGRQALAEAVGARDLFFSMASHELKTPLTSLKLQLQIARRDLKAEATEMPASAKLTKAVESSLRQVTSLTKLVNDLLDVSRLRTGHFILDLEPLDFSELVREVTDRFSEQLVAAGCQMKLVLAPAAEVRWDRQRMEQVLVNLISNAIKYAPGAPLHVSTQMEGATVTLIVEDFGPGIDVAKQEIVFESFERAGLRSKVEGLGLGLYIVRKIVDAHHGTIRLISEIDRGSKFIVEIPDGRVL